MKNSWLKNSKKICPFNKWKNHELVRDLPSLLERRDMTYILENQERECREHLEDAYNLYSNFIGKEIVNFVPITSQDHNLFLFRIRVNHSNYDYSLNITVCNHYSYFIMMCYKFLYENNCSIS